MSAVDTSTTEAASKAEAITSLYEQFVVPTYGRFPLCIERGEGSRLWDVDGRRYLDFGGGIAVTSLGHSHPELADTLATQAQKLWHCSNLYYTEDQGKLAEKIVSHVAPGKVFFNNSGAEANEALIKLARKAGNAEGRFEIITATNSFHGRTMAGIAATGQDKVKEGFSPMLPGFSHVPFNDLEAMAGAVTPATIAILIEGVQGEGGINPATSEYLLGLRKLCDEKGLLLLMDGVQCGFFRTGNFQSFQSILSGQGDQSFLPDGISMAKSLGGGFPMGCTWISEKYQDLLGPGTHGTTFGGTPLACAVALKIFEIIERDDVAANAAKVGQHLIDGLLSLQSKYPQLIKTVRGMGMMIGTQLQADIPLLKDSGRPASIAMVLKLHEAGLITIPSGPATVRFLPALNLTMGEADEGLSIFENTLKTLLS